MVFEKLEDVTSSDEQFLITDAFGVERWYKNDVLHHDNDLPAEIFPLGGKKTWYVNGLLHREHSFPAKTWRHVQEYYLFGCRHRTNGRAIAASIDHYALYDYKLTSEEHHIIMQEYETKNIYLHVAFLSWYLNTPNELVKPYAIIDELTTLHNDLPLSWFEKVIGQERLPLSETALNNFINFIEYEKIHQIIQV